MLTAILFDFGGVLAEEGFREGLKEIARKNGLDPDHFYSTADKLIYETGYLTGHTDEPVYWNTLRARTGINGTDQELREEILKRFVLRPDMITCVDILRSEGFLVAMLSDQTNWLEEIDRETSLFGHFDRVFNSIRTHLSKRDARTFRKVCDMLMLKPEETLFIDDNRGHIQRAKESEMQTILFATFDDFEKKMQILTGKSCRK